MFEHIDPRSSTPLYAQIADRVRVAIAAGELRAAAPLPSVRELAARLRVNPATIAQAYRELEAEGFVEIRHGAGTYAREVAPGRRTRERARQAKALVERLLGDARRMGVSLDELREAIDGALGANTT